MATLKSIQFKRSKTPGAKPTAAQLDEGELAINLRDRTIFTKSDQGQIIDLGFAKGGQVDGDVTINGKLTLNGAYVQTLAGINTAGGIYSGADISATTFRTRNGSFYTRASNTTSNSHVWFENSDGSERGVLYAKPQLENEGTISMRVKKGTATGAGDVEFHFISSGGGIFQAPILKATTSINAPTISVDLVNHDSKAFGQYDSQSLVNYTYPGTGETNGINYLRKVRSKSGGTIYHEIVTAQTGQADEVSWWTGNTPLSKQYGIRNDGRMIIRNSLAIGTMMEGFPSSDYGNVGALGTVFLALGDNGSGLVYKKTGVYDLVGSGLSVASITPDSFRSTRKALFGRSENQGADWIMPGINAAFLSVVTNVDDNNSGDGMTHIGYNSSGKMSHYFRGNGMTSVNTKEGLTVEPGFLTVKTGSNIVNINADGVINSVQRISIRTGLFVGGDDNTNAISFKAPTGVDGTKTLNWDAGTRNGQNKNTVTLKAWGNSFNSTGERNRETVFEVGDSHGYHYYSQRLAPTGTQTVGSIQFRVNGGLVTGGSISTEGSITATNGMNINGGATFNGQVKIGGTADALRIWNAEYGMIFRRSETGASAAFHLIPTLQNAGENGGISDLRPLSINLSNGSVLMGNNASGGALLTVDNIGKRIQMDGRLRVNMDSDGLVVNAASQAASNFIQGRKADVTKWYLGIGDGGNVVRMHSYTYAHGVALNADTVDITKPLKIGPDIRIGTDGNIIGSATLSNFKNLNMTLDRKVTAGGWQGGATLGWYKFASVTIPQSTGTATFRISGGNGFNVNSYGQAAVAEVVLRTGNNNPAGINAVLWNRTDDSFRQVATVATGGNDYDLYLYIGGYSNSLVVEYWCSENSSVSVIGLNEGTQPVVATLPTGYVMGKTVRLLNNIDGNFAAGESDIVTRGEYVTNNQKGVRIKSKGNDIGSNALLVRNDGGSSYLLITDTNTASAPNAADGGWNGKRPFAISMTSGDVILGENTKFNKDITIDGNFVSRVKVVGNWNVGFADISDVTRDRSAFLVNTGAISKTSQSYYPLFSGYSSLQDAGYRQSFEFGWLGVSGNWRQGIIRMRGDNATGQQARWTFDMDGTFYTPKLTCGSTGALGVNTTNSWGGNSITIGDSDTGLRQVGDGLLEVWTNAVRRMRFQSGDTYSDMNINAPNVYIRSDIRLKSNFRPIENALEKVEQLDGLIYDKADYIGGEVVQTEAGVIAQQLDLVLPEAVHEVEDIKGNKVLTVSTQSQVALLIEAVKTLSAKVRELEAKLN